MTFVERFAPWSDEQKEAAARVLRLVEEQRLEVVRISFPDQHGLLRGKTLVHDAPALYLCRNFTCQAPITDPGEVLSALEAVSRGTATGLVA